MQQDLRRILACIEDLAPAGDVSTFVRRALPAIDTLVGGDVITYSEIDLRKRRDDVQTYPPGLITRDQLSRYSQYMHQHPLIQHYRHRPRERAPAKISDFIMQTRFQRLTIYTEFFKDLRVEHQIACPIARDTPMTGVTFTVCRSRGDFSEHSRGMLHLLQGHVAFMHQRIRSHQRVKDTLDQVTMEGALGIIVVDGMGIVKLAVGPGLQRLREAFGPLAEGRILPQGFGQSVAANLGDGRGLGSTQPGCGRLIEADRCKVHVTLVPLANSPGEVLVLVHEEPSIITFESEELTPRELEVVGLVALGLSNVQVAKRLEISPRTVQKHLENIFRKLDIQSRTEVARAYWQEMAIGER